MSADPEPLEELVPLSRPAAFGDWRRTARLTWVLAKTDFRQQYANSILGYLWAPLEPFLLWAVLYFVLDRVLTFGSQIEHYSSFLLMNVILYFFFRQATTRGYKPIRAKGGNLMRKMEFPRVVLPLSAVLSTALSFLGALPPLFLVMLLTGVTPMWSWLLFPLALLALFIFAFATALVLAGIYARIPDLDHIRRLLIRIQFYVTPVLFAIQIIPATRLRGAILVNPLTLILTEANRWMIDPGAPSISEVSGSSEPMLIAIGIFAATCIIGPLIFARTATKVAERV